MRQLARRVQLFSMERPPLLCAIENEARDLVKNLRHVHLRALDVFVSSGSQVRRLEQTRLQTRARHNVKCVDEIIRHLLAEHFHEREAEGCCAHCIDGKIAKTPQYVQRLSTFTMLPQLNGQVLQEITSLGGS